MDVNPWTVMGMALAITGGALAIALVIELGGWVVRSIRLRVMRRRFRKEYQKAFEYAHLTAVEKLEPNPGIRVKHGSIVHAESEADAAERVAKGLWL